MNDGWIKLHRGCLDHWLYNEYRPLTKREAWETILLTVNYESNKTLIKGQLYDCKSGQSLLSLESWSKKFVWSLQQVRTFFKLLEADGMITIEGLQYTTRLTVCKWDTYQGITTDQQQTDNRPLTDQQQTANRPLTTIKERKERKERKEEREEKNLAPENRFLIQIDELENYLLSQEQWIDVICMQNKIDKGEAVDWIRKFVEKLKLENVKEKTPADAFSHFANWFKLEKQKTKINGTQTKQNNSSGFARKDYDPNNGIGDGTLMSDTRRPDKYKGGKWWEFRNGEYVISPIQNKNKPNLP
jgi:hypothetical protein